MQHHAYIGTYVQPNTKLPLPIPKPPKYTPKTLIDDHWTNPILKYNYAEQNWAVIGAALPPTTRSTKACSKRFERSEEQKRWYSDKQCLPKLTSCPNICCTLGNRDYFLSVISRQKYPLFAHSDVVALTRVPTNWSCSYSGKPTSLTDRIKTKGDSLTTNSPVAWLHMHAYYKKKKN